MSDDEKSGLIGETAKAVAEIAKAVPIYQDAVQPAAKEIGKSLHLVAKAVNAALAPVEGLVWGVDRIRDFVRERVATKLDNVPPEDVQQPKPHVAVPAIEALRYTGAESDLAELYANLLATSMDKATAYRAHPGFVDMIKNMSPDEARIMKFLATSGSQPLVNIKFIMKEGGGFSVPHRHLSLIGLKAGCEHVPLASTYLDNLIRLGLVEIPPMTRIKADEPYTEIEDHSEVKAILEDLRKIETHRVDVEKIRLNLTDLGRQFVRTCVIDKSAQDRS
ncbi:MAG: DUF4393 domain-containing protein [Xanthomonadaceae bacterium]|nr:DUF4393 domain-containing protein [Xanthomonadaceae bacterium]MDP2186374.1 DUF4393 domain-containing protein [Xanthomonadales bacterium]MDZ4114704.1 DUF4393 domain-containing protein [Xanthomonadaceae bacterium]MDZ4377242.1 DUF4393 domain-containing protein [Xanthomonadaceae bacterium]